MSSDANGTSGFLPVALEIAEVIGVDMAEALIEAYGGTRIYIPRKIHPEHSLAKCIGLRPAMKLCEHFALGSSGQGINLPKNANLRGYSRFAEVAKMSDEGLSLDRIALAMNLHTRTVSRLRAKLNRRRASLYRKQIKHLLAEGRKPFAIAKAIGLPVHSTKAIIAIILEGESS